MLRFEAIAHNTAELRCGRMIEKFPEIVTRLAGIVERFATALDCVDTGFIGDGILDELPTGVRLGATRVGGVDLNKPRMRDALRAALALAPAPNGFTVAEFTAKVHAITGVITAATPSARPATTCASCGANSSSTNPAGPAATTSHPRPHAPSPPCSPSATRSSPRSSPRCAARAWDANPRTGPASTVTTNESASICKRSSMISPSKRR